MLHGKGKGNFLIQLKASCNVTLETEI